MMLPSVMCDSACCTRCKATKPHTHFQVNRGRRRSICRECAREHNLRRAHARKKLAEQVTPQTFDVGFQFNRWRGIAARPATGMW